MKNGQMKNGEMKNGQMKNGQMKNGQRDDTDECGTSLFIFRKVGPVRNHKLKLGRLVNYN